MTRLRKNPRPAPPVTPAWYSQPRTWALAGGAAVLVMLALLGWKWLATPHLKVVAVKDEADAVFVTAREKRGLSREHALMLIDQAVKRYPGKQKTTIEIYDEAAYAETRVESPSAYSEDQYQQHRLASYFHDSKSGAEQWELPKK